MFFFRICCPDKPSQSVASVFEQVGECIKSSTQSRNFRYRNKPKKNVYFPLMLPIQCLDQVNNELDVTLCQFLLALCAFDLSYHCGVGLTETECLLVKHEHIQDTRSSRWDIFVCKCPDVFDHCTYIFCK